MPLHRTAIMIEPWPVTEGRTCYQVQIAGRADPDRMPEVLYRMVSQAAEGIDSEAAILADDVYRLEADTGPITYTALDLAASTAAAEIPQWAPTQAERIILFALAMPGRAIGAHFIGMMPGPSPLTQDPLYVTWSTNHRALYLHRSPMEIGDHYDETPAGLRALASEMARRLQLPSRPAPAGNVQPSTLAREIANITRKGDRYK